MCIGLKNVGPLLMKRLPIYLTWGSAVLLIKRYLKREYGEDKVSVAAELLYPSLFPCPNLWGYVVYYFSVW